MLSPSSICLFGGTFDPIHEGHLDIAIQAKETLHLDKVIFIPCYQSPHKLEKKVTPGKSRYDMCKLATADLDWTEVSDYEIASPSPSFSYQTAKYFSQIYPNYKLYWLLGTDQWNALPQWKNIDLLAKLVTFIVCQRGKTESIDQIYPKYCIKTNHPASSTKIRTQVANQIPPKWLHSSVEQYVRAHKFYL